MSDKHHPVFSVPELLAHIATYLSPQDVSRWMLTCKLQSRLLEPCFWRHVVLRKNYQDSSALVRYRHHLRSVEIDIDNPAHLRTLVEGLPKLPSNGTNEPSKLIQGFPNLKALTLGLNERLGPEAMEPLLLVLEYSHYLTQLDLPGKVLDQDSLSHQLLEAIANNLPHLLCLSLDRAIIHPKTVFSLIDVCFKHSRLIDLRCECYTYTVGTQGVWEYGPGFVALQQSLQDADDEKMMAGQQTGLRFASLLLPPIERGYPASFIIPFLRSQVPHLEWLGVPAIDGPYSSHELKTAISEGCPKLQRITVNASFMPASVTLAVGKVVQSSTQLGLKSIVIWCLEDTTPFQASKMVMKDLIHQHANTLEEIELLACLQAWSVDLASVLATCKKLKKFRIERPIIGDVSIAFRDAVAREWVCKDLVELNIYLNRGVVVPAGATLRQVMAQNAKEVYAKIGRLVKLESLGLGWEMESFPGDFMNDLTLEHGWLAQLSGLKELRHFQMEKDFWSSMGQAEIAFMVVNWPKLESIAIAAPKSETERVFTLPHWQWLQVKRPHIVLS
ncbi:hypothetical protein B0O80DRAFT_104332 [Mortierella sp. GBAus27b]|nr:hypothetical protein BGX31_009946 [Mortierella sp. GBA43]KAI8351892.1 hypothetical protein B0O80DRAFT_104332 [Mortierella sp. GBAus27b]